MGKTYRKFTTSELIAYVRGFLFTRPLTQLHVHHTYLPDHKQFTGNNYDALNWGMEYYHVNTAKYSTIAQHLTLFPDGTWLLGRDFNMNPASIIGWNTGAFCIEMVGNFDSGNDLFRSPQADAIYEFCEFMVETKRLAMKFHRDSPTAYKTCPGTGIDRATFFDKVANFTENKLAEVARRQAIERQEREKAEAQKRVEELKRIMSQVRVLFTDMMDKATGNVHFSNDYVNFLADKKIVKGYDNGDGTFKFDPNKAVTRGELAVMLAKAIESIEETIHAVVKPFDGSLTDSKDS